MHFGIISPPVQGHIHPFGALGRTLVQRGHRVTLFHMADLEGSSVREGLGFCPIGHADHPKGSLAISLQRLAQLQGVRALRFTMSAVAKTSEMFCRDLPEALAGAGVDALLVDQMEPAGAAVAELLGLPFVTVCNALLLNEEPGVPPPFTGWSAGSQMLARLRNQAGYQISRLVMRPVSRVVDGYRSRWRLRPWSNPDASFSQRAQICQLPREFDFPRQSLPANFHYVGPIRAPRAVADSFPWDKLDGRPLIYASLGTLQNKKIHIFKLFAEACVGLEVQLVIAGGGGIPPAVAGQLPGAPLVVDFAPQEAVLRKASLTLTHAGLNTVLDSMSAGVPLIAVPLTYEQPAIASRIRHAGAGKVISLQNLTSKRLRTGITEVLKSQAVAMCVTRLQSAIRRAGGSQQAADIVELATA